jgi:hypothetical protein
MRLELIGKGKIQSAKHRFVGELLIAYIVGIVDEECTERPRARASAKHGPK